MSPIQLTDPLVYDIIQAEKIRQAQGMEMIASENYQSAAVLETQSCVLANKYSEGTP
jgi:glycine hydroxymethyltransferase